MTKPGAWNFALVSLLAFGGAHAPSLGAQTLSLVAGFSTSLTIASPTAAQYDAASPANVTNQNGAPNFKLHSTCTGSNNFGCRLFILRGSAHQATALDLQYQVVTAVGCTGLTANTSIWTDVPTASTQIAATNKNNTCDAEFAFRVRNLDYSVQMASATYMQDVTFNFTRP